MRDIASADLPELAYDDFTDEVHGNTAYVIRTGAEFSKYMHSSYAVVSPYDGYVIIIARGTVTNGVVRTDAKLQEKDGKYTLVVDVYGDDTMVVGCWNVAMRVDGFPANKNVTLRLHTHNTRSLDGLYN